jgi:hypothetical protein
MPLNPLVPSVPKRRGRKPAPSLDMGLPETSPGLDLQGLMGLAPDLENAIEIPMDDGSVEIHINNGADAEQADAGKHDANLALVVPDYQLGVIAEELLEGIDADERSRDEWMSSRAKGIDLLGVKLENPRSGTGSSAPLEGMSVVRDPVLLEAVLRFQANAQGELLPSAGPVKAINYGGTSEGDKLADDLERDLNYYLTSVASEYYPDTRRMFFWTGFSGMAFKKVYRCPLRRRPVSESVDAADLVVSDTITDLRNAARITHQITMRPSTMKRMQIVGAYRDVVLTQPTEATNEIKEKVADVQGISASQRPQDQPYTVYECYCELDIKGFEHKDDAGKPTGLPIPYIVTIEKDSRTVLQIRRNWKENDTDYIAKIPFVAFGYAPGLGFYSLGLLHILGNLTNALTALTREAIDAGMFANFPGFLYAKSASRQMTNEFRVPPGGGMPIETNGLPIGQSVMPLPYKSVDPAHIQLIAGIREVANRLGNVAEANIGEGRQDAPVGTTIALIEQATKIEGAVHKALHAAQAEEFRLLCDLFREDPESLWRGNRRPALERDVKKFMAALDQMDIVPAADPNVPSHMHRVMKATAIKELASSNPQMYNQVAVDSRVLAMLNVDRPDELFMPPQPQAPPTPTPDKMLEVSARNEQAEKDRQLKADLALLAEKSKDKDRQSKQNTEVFKAALTAHQGSIPTGGEVVQAAELAQTVPLTSPSRSPPAVGAPPPSAPPPQLPPMPPPMPMRQPPPNLPGLGGLSGLRPSGPPHGMPFLPGALRQRS